jgi:hypothetical protein
MDEHDRKNLEFLLNAEPGVLLDWYEKMDVDDHMYAMALLEVARLELLDQIVITRDYCVDAQRLLKNIFQ